MGQYSPALFPELLAEHSVKYRQTKFIAEQVLPPLGVDSLKVSYFLFTRADASRIPDTAMAADGEANQLKYSKSEVDVTLKPDGLFDRIPVEQLQSTNTGGDDELDTVESLTDGLLMRYEKDASDVLMTAANYGSSNKVTLTNPWTDWTSGTPIADIQTGKRACATDPNVMVMDEVSWDALSSHPDIVRFLGGQNPEGLPDTTRVARYFGLEECFVGKVKYNSANEGATASYSYIWPQGKVLIARIAQQPRRDELTLARAYRMRYTANDNSVDSAGMMMAGASGENGGFIVTRGVEGTRGTKGTLYIKVACSQKIVQVASDAGYLISGAA